MSNQETGLMKKTKKELVEIILRKDDEEVKLKKQIAELETVVHELSKTKKNLITDLEKANHQVSEFKSGMDEVASQKAEIVNINSKLANKLKTTKFFAWFFAIIAIVLGCFILFV